MALPVQAVLDRTSNLLKDADFTRWTAAERIRWGNEAMGAILTRRPQAFATRAVVDLVAGTYQTIPANGSMLLDVTRNIAANGTTAGRAIRRTDRQLLDDTDPDWQSSTAKGTIKNYTFDERMPTVFYTYPPAAAGTKVEIFHAALPEDVAENDTDGEFGIGAEYLEAVVNYVCFRCFSKDDEWASLQGAIAYFQAFENALGVKNQSQVAASPNQPTASV